MNNYKKIALVTAIAAVSAGTQAELKALDDSTMSELTGQGGLTIDLETQLTIGEFAYQDNNGTGTDGGFVLLQNLQFGGSAAGSLLDNVRMTIDVAGSDVGVGFFLPDPEFGYFVGFTAPTPIPNTLLSYGFSEVKDLAYFHLAAGNADATSEFAAAAGSSLAFFRTGAPYACTPEGCVLVGGNSNYTMADAVTGVTTTAVIEDERRYNDGDLKIHFGFTDIWEKGGGFDAFSTGNGTSVDGSVTGLSLASASFAQAIEIATQSIDFRFTIDALGIAASSYEVGTQGQTLSVNSASGQLNGTDHVTGLDSDGTTTLISGINMRGFLGPEDIHIENNGNGFGGGTGRGDADSKVHWDSYFNITDLDIYIDIAGLQLTDITINNIRGDLTGIEGKAAFGFAHSKLDIYAVKDAVVAPATPSGFVDGVALNRQFKGDIDIGAISFGDTGTTLGSIFMTDVFSTTNWTISAH